jgi:tRNA A-37 threonylcarbamoyl transferase component Bud32
VNPAAIGRYQIIGEVGAGGFATVYRARDPMLDREVAVKVLHAHLARDPQLRERFVREGRALARVRHPNVVQIYDAGEVNGPGSGAGPVYLAMEFVPGRTLAQIARGRLMPLAEVLSVVRQIAPALDAIHAAGLVHRDIKPANILIEERGAGPGRAVLLDLGIARSMDNTGLTTSGLLLGTPGYLAPEQVEGAAEVGPSTDVYQLGATTYALLAGRPPFEGDTAQVLYAVAHRAPRDLAELRPDLPPHAVAAVAEALAKSPSRRPARATDFAASLDGHAPATPRLPPAPPPPPPIDPTLPLPAIPPEGWEGTTVVHPASGSGRPAGGGMLPGWGGVPQPAPVPRRWWLPFAAAGAALALGGAALGGYAVSRSRDGTAASPTASARASAATPSATATTLVAPPTTPTLSPSSGAVTATAVTATATPTRPPSTPAATATPVRIVTPTDPARQIRIPDGLPAAERAVLELLNRNGPAYIAAVRGPDEGPLRGIFTGPALDDYSRHVATLRQNGQYEVADLLTISLAEFQLDGPDDAYARTVERWTNARYDRASGRRLSGTETLYNEEYRFVRIDGAWLIHLNPNTVISRSEN